MPRYCANCGTEVEESAAFCPTCGQPIDESAAAEIPPAPAWPDDRPAASPPREVAAEPTARAESGFDQPTRVEPLTPPPPEPASGTAPPPVPAAERPGPDHQAPDRTASHVELPITWPVTLSGWLIGIGAFLAALGALLGFFGGFINPIDVVLLLALIGIVVAVFLSDRVPHIPHLRLATLVVALIGFGLALDRIAFARAGADELLLFLGTAMAAMGAILLELGQDQPLGGPRS